MLVIAHFSSGDKTSSGFSHFVHSIWTRVTLSTLPPQPPRMVIAPHPIEQPTAAVQECDDDTTWSIDDSYSDDDYVFDETDIENDNYDDDDDDDLLCDESI